MNAGIVASRYAKALLKFVQETGNGEKVYAQVSVLAFRMHEVMQLRDYIQKHHEIDVAKKLQLLEAALGEPLAMEICRFTNLVIARHRSEFFLRMLISFLVLYREAHNIKVGRLITACQAEGLKERMEQLLHEKTGAEVLLEQKIDPEILGGFVFELDDWRMDASVAGQFRKIKAKLIDNTKRIV
ncbi:MAG: ATP synthase F1 subunit delta [Bacteroidales bacterium]|nr:ATP synthase F1 subunit delta [Bacteroidales bacterium]